MASSPVAGLRHRDHSRRRRPARCCAADAASTSRRHAAEIAERAARGKSDFMPHHLQRVLVDPLRVPQRRRPARALVRRPRAPTDAARKARVDPVSSSARSSKHMPQLVSWNGGGFDLPVLHYRGLLHGVVRQQVLGPWRGRPRVRLQQLRQPLSPAPSRPDGPAGDVSAARQCAARRDGAAVRISRQARHGRLAGLRRVARRGASTRSAATARPT